MGNDPRTAAAHREAPPARQPDDYRGPDRASEALDEGLKYADQAQQVATEKLGDLETAIRRNPLRAAAIAAGVGFVLALIARR